MVDLYLNFDHYIERKLAAVIMNEVPELSLPKRSEGKNSMKARE